MIDGRTLTDQSFLNGALEDSLPKGDSVCMCLPIFSQRVIMISKKGTHYAAAQALHVSSSKERAPGLWIRADLGPQDRIGRSYGETICTII
jgi:hypothetical protein